MFFLCLDKTNDIIIESKNSYYLEQQQENEIENFLKSLKSKFYFILF